MPLSQSALSPLKPSVHSPNAVDVNLVTMLGNETRQADPLLGSHCRRRLIDSQFQVAGEATQLPRREQRSQGRSYRGAPYEALCHQVTKYVAVARSDQRSGPKLQVEQSGVNCGRGTEDCGGKMCEHASIPPRIQQASNEGAALAAAHHIALGRLSLNDQIGVLGWINSARQLGDNGGRDVERQARADLVSPARELTAQKVRVDERDIRRISEATFKEAENSRINLVSHDVAAALRQRPGKRTSPGPDIEDKVVGRDRGFSEKLACDPPRSQEVLRVFGSLT